MTKKKYGEKSTSYLNLKGRTPSLKKPNMITVRLNTVTEQEWQEFIEHCNDIGVSLNIMLSCVLSSACYLEVTKTYAQLIQIQANKEKKKLSAKPTN